MNFFRQLFGFQLSPQPKAEPKRVERVEVKPLPKADKTMYTLASHLVVEPFGKINYWSLPNGGKRMRVYFLMERAFEGAQTGVALDGSGSMRSNFGLPVLRQQRQPTQVEWRLLIRQGLAHEQRQKIELLNPNHPRTISTLVKFGVINEMPSRGNIVEEQAREMTKYLTQFDADGGTTVIYWATGDGAKIEEVGDLKQWQCSTTRFTGPKAFGNSTYLLPAIKYFVNRFTEADWGIYLFITDGALHDLEQVKRYSTELAREIDAGKRKPLKFVLIGVGNAIDEQQMQELDDLETGTTIDLWDHKIAKEMKQLAEIFAEVVNENIIIAPSAGIIKDAHGTIIKDYRDTGLPALMTFELPPTSPSFSLELGHQKVIQPVSSEQ